MKTSLLLTVAAVLLAGPALSGTGPLAQYQVGDRLPQKKEAPAAPAAGRYAEVRWESLIAPGWNPNALFKDLNLGTMLDSDPRAIAALERLRAEWDNAPANPAYNGADVRIAGFVVPLERAGQALREFLLVPYFGACIHVPPPPANQIIHVVADKPIANLASMDAVWASGRLEVLRANTQMGSASYRMKAALVEAYKAP